VAKAMVNKATALGVAGRSEEAVADCDDLIIRFGRDEFKEPPPPSADLSELVLRESVGIAMLSKLIYGGQLTQLRHRDWFFCGMGWFVLAVFRGKVRRGWSFWRVLCRNAENSDERRAFFS
jgi:hypothetical protein